MSEGSQLSPEEAAAWRRVLDGLEDVLDRAAEVEDETRGALVALRHQCHVIARSPIGAHHATVREAACAMAPHIASSALTVEHVASHLLGSALALGLGDPVARDAIREGLEIGLSAQGWKVR